MKTKICRRCGKRKSAFDFYANKHNKDKLCSYCKICQSEYNRGWRTGNNEYLTALEFNNMSVSEKRLLQSLYSL